MPRPCIFRVAGVQFQILQRAWSVAISVLKNFSTRLKVAQAQRRWAAVDVEDGDMDEAFDSAMGVEIEGSGATAAKIRETLQNMDKDTTGMWLFRVSNDSAYTNVLLWLSCSHFVVYYCRLAGPSTARAVAPQHLFIKGSGRAAHEAWAHGGPSDLPGLQIHTH